MRQVLLRVLMTSRLELYICLSFKQMLNRTHYDLVVYKVAKNTINHDMHVCLEYKLTRTREERSLPLDWPGERCIQTLVNMAVPLLIFAATVRRFIGETSGNPQRRLEDILGST